MPDVGLVWGNWWEKTASPLSICPEALIGSVQLRNDPSDTKWNEFSLRLKIWLGSYFGARAKRCHSSHCVLKKTYHLMPGGKWRDSGWLPRKVGFSSVFVCWRMCACAKRACVCRVLLWYCGIFPLRRHSLHRLTLDHDSTKVLRKCEWKMETAAMERDRYWVSICLSAEGLRLRSVICVSVQMAG